jgi:exosortase/archaeosortase family protein
MLTSVKTLLKKPLYRFLLYAVGFYVFWYVLYDLWIHPMDSFDLWVISKTMNMARFILNMLGFVTFSNEGRLLGIDGTAGLWMGDNCDSVELCAIFSGFIIAYPGFVKRKLWYLPMGWLLITFINALRIVALALVQRYYSKKWLDFNHTYTFTIIVYGFIFLLWFIWINKTAKSSILSKPNKTT